MKVKEQFIVLRAVYDKNQNTFLGLNMNAPEAPPTFDSYGEAAEWISNHGIQLKYYQIQKFLMPT